MKKHKKKREQEPTDQDSQSSQVLTSSPIPRKSRPSEVSQQEKRKSDVVEEVTIEDDGKNEPFQEYDSLRLWKEQRRQEKWNLLPEEEKRRRRNEEKKQKVEALTKDENQVDEGRKRRRKRRLTITQRKMLTLRREN